MAAGTRLGAVTAEAAEATGLAMGTSVGAGGHDHVCGALAAGVREHGMCLDSMGTAESAFIATAAPLLDAVTPQAGVNLGVHVARDRWYLMRGVSSAGAAVNWAGTLFGAGAGVPPYARLEALASSAPSSLGVLFVPRLTGGDRGAFIGLTADADAAVLARAVYEGLAYEWRRCLELLEGTLGGAAQSIRLIGGGTRMRLWVQIKADVLDRPLQLLTLDESVALGAALLGGIAGGVYRDENVALAGLRRDLQIIEADPVRAVRHARIYQDSYLPIAPALADIHAALGGYSL